MPRQMPQHPIARAIVERMRTTRLDRRTLLKGSALGAATFGLGTLAACSPKDEFGDGSRGTVRWANWTYYLDFDEETGNFDSLNAFMAESDIRVEYFEDIDDNKTFVAKIRDQLELGHDTGYDVFTLTDSELVRLYEKDQLLAFDRSAMPNVERNMLDLVKEVTFDPNREISIPYQAGMTGLVYNKILYPKGIREVSDLWAPELAGKVSLLSENMDTIALVMLEQGVDIKGDWGEDEWLTALAVVEEQLRSGQVATVKGNSYTQDLQREDVWAGMAWSGDIAMLNDEAGEEIWEFVIPDSGASMFIDSFCMPASTQVREQVQELIDYYYDPYVAAEVAAYVQYVTPVEGAQEAMLEIDPDLAEDPLIFPDDEMQAQIHIPRAITPEEDNRFAMEYQRVLGN